MEKKRKIFRKFFHYLCAEKIQSEKNFEVTFSVKRSPHKLRKINETMNPMIDLGHEIYELK